MGNTGDMDVPIPPGCGVPPVTRRGLDAAVETLSAALSGTAEHWTRRLPGGDRRRGGAHRARPGQPRRGLPGRLAGHHLGGAAPGAHQHADHRRRADRLPRRRRGPPRGRLRALRRRHALPPQPRRAGQRRAEGGVAARRVPRHQARERGRQAAPAPGPRARGTARAPLPGLRGLVQAHPGRRRPVYLWLVEHLFRDNELVAGTLRIDQPVDLAAITCPVNLLAGTADHITPPAQVFALEQAVSTPADQVCKRTTSGGHLGLFMGGEALREHWPAVMARVYEHSQAGADAGAARRRSADRTQRRRPIPAP